MDIGDPPFLRQLPMLLDFYSELCYNQVVGPSVMLFARQAEISSSFNQRAVRV